MAQRSTLNAQRSTLNAQNYLTYFSTSVPIIGRFNSFIFWARIIPICFFLSTCFLASAQFTTFPCMDTVNIAVGKEAKQSSTSGLSYAWKAINNITSGNQRSKTNNEDNAWWEVDLGEICHVNGIRFYLREGYMLSNYYVFVSEIPFVSENLDDLLNSNAVESIHIPGYYPSGFTLQFNETRGRYLRLMLNYTGVLEMIEAQIPGSPIEDCNNGNDDDCDGLVDCADWADCGAYIVGNNNIYTNPSCPIYNDGSIEIYGAASNTSPTSAYSLDGGATWQPSKLFNNLDEGAYNLAVGNPETGCVVQYDQNPVFLQAPPGQPAAHCENGDFENGDFTNWTGFVGSIASGLDMEPTPVIVQGRHTIISGPQTDYYAPIQVPLQGTYCVKLGNFIVGSEAEALRYCFDVNAAEPIFQFQFAVVIQNGHDNPNENSFFSTKFFRQETNGSLTELTQFSEKLNSDDDDFFIHPPNSPFVLFRGWTCRSIDLSSEIGNNLCVEFTVTDCSEGNHWGYAYIDALCVTPPPPSPALELEENYCFGQAIIAEASSSAHFNHFTLDVSEVSSDGTLVNTATESHAAYMLNTFNISEIYSAHDFEIECDKHYKIVLTLSNDCYAPVSVEKLIFIPCTSVSLAYKDIVICGTPTSGAAIQFEGNNNCINCSYSWNASPYLNDISVEFPSIDGTTASLSVNSYMVTATSPDGCISTDIVNVYHVQVAFSQEDDSYCTRTIYITSTGVPPQINSFLNISLINNATQQNIATSYSSSNFTTLTNAYVISKGSAIDVTGEASWAFPSSNSNFIVISEEDCSSTVTFSFPAQVEYFDEFNVGIPAYFTPNGDGLNDLFKPVQLPGTFHNAISCKIEVFPQWGPKIFEGESSSTFGGPPLSFSSVGWNGGDIPLQGVYLFLVQMSNCKYPNFSECTVGSAIELNSGTPTNTCRWEGDVTLGL